MFGTTYFVGPAALGSVLVATNDGLVLVNAALPESATGIDARIRSFGVRTGDVRFILTSHAHYDHVGGVHALQRFTGATASAAHPPSRR